MTHRAENSVPGLAARPVIRARGEHTVSRRDIDPDALKVLYHLSRHGHIAYLVGGGVRDLLLGRAPKDFDIGTSAHPNDIRRLFRNCFLIGRRFRLAHIRFGQKVIETSTFRRQPEIAEAPESADVELYNHRDNTFGTPEEDARRRDFTINGLFYDIRTFDVIDHVGGLEDLDRRVIRSIGDANIRFREDPVRMLRAVRFASRLGFAIEEQTYAAILRHHEELSKAAPARLLEEIYRLFAYRSGEAAFRLLRETRLLSVLFPEIDGYLAQGGAGTGLFWDMLAALDQRSAAGGEATPPALMFGTLVYPLFLDLRREMSERGAVPHMAEIERQLLRPLALRCRMPKRVFYDVLRILDAQRHFEGPPLRRQQMERLVRQEAAPLILALREIYLAATDGDLSTLDEWRAALQHSGGAAGDAGGGEAAPRAWRRRRPRRGRRSGGGNRPPDGGSGEQGAGGE